MSKILKREELHTVTLNKNLFLEAAAYTKAFDKLPLLPSRNGFGEALLELGKTNDSVVALTADLAESTRVLDFAKAYPDRFIECGVSEQNMMSVAAGLALAGKIPFVASYAVFSPGRSWDQLRVSVCYSEANVKIMGAHAGVSVGPDGATHQALEDIAITRVLPNLIVIVPCDAPQTKAAVLAAAQYTGPVYIRFGREKTAVLTTAETPFEIGKAQQLTEGNDVGLIACGSLVNDALQAAHKLAEQGIAARVINNHTVKPLDEKTIEAAAKECGAIVTIEEHQVMGGMGSAVSELVAQRYPVPIEFVGMPDTFGQSGSARELLTAYGMSAAAIETAAQKVMQRKQSL